MGLVVMIFLLLSASAWATEIIVVKSANLKPYNDALRGFKSTSKANIKEILLSEMNGLYLEKEIIRRNPDLILTVGEDALSQVKDIRGIPIVFMMVSNPYAILSGESNITGVSMNILAKKQVDMVLEVIPKVKRIGIIYDPNNTSQLVKEIQSSSNGITIIAQRVNNSKEVPLIVKNLKGQYIDVIWLLPDITVITKETMEFMLIFSLENGIPILAFSDKYVENGSLMALDIDAVDIGLQAGEMANKILSGINTSNIPIGSPRKAVLSLNLKTATKLSIAISEEVLKKAQRIYK